MGDFMDELIEKIRNALRISSNSDRINAEINDCIAACLMDLQNDGVGKVDVADPLIIRSLILYCKAEFGYSEDSEKFRRSYDVLKARLSMSKAYMEEDADGLGQ